MFEARENGGTVSGEAVIRLCRDGICILPTDEHARRIPLCFISGMEKGNFSVTLPLLTGERYTLSKMGYETEPFVGRVTEALRSLRERSVAQLRELDGALGSMQAATAAKLMPEGAHTSGGAGKTDQGKQNFRQLSCAETFVWR